MGNCVTNKYYSGQGTLLVGNRDVNGNPTGLRPVGNCPAVNVQSTATTFEHKESCSGERGIDYSKTTELAVDLTFTMENFNAANLAMVLYGTESAKSAGTVTDEAVVMYQDAWTPLAHVDISTVVVTNVAGDTTYVEGTDYEVNYKAGSIQGLSATFASGDDVHVDYAYGAQEAIEAFTSGNAPDMWFRFEGLNTTGDTSEPVVIDFYRVNPQPLADWALINDELASGEISSKVLSDALRASGSKFYTVKKV